ALRVPDQRGPGGRRGAAGYADVSRQVRHGRVDRPEGVLCGDHRRLQPDAWRAARGRAGRRPGKPDRRLHLARVQGGGCAAPLPRRHHLPARGPAGQGRGAQGMNNAQKIALLVLLALYAILPLFLKNYGIYLMTLLCVYLMAAFGLNLIVGYAGQMSIGQAAFYGIGAYIAAILMTKVGVSFWLVLPIAAVVWFIIGLMLGFPALRVRHHYLAFATLGFNVLVYLVMRNEEQLTGGTFGIKDIPRPSLFGYSLDGSLPFFYFAFVSVILLAAVLWWLLRSPWGRAFAALRDNPIRAESTGVNITAYTLLAFAIGAACAGVSGVYLASLVEFVEPSQFQISTSLMMLLAVIIGGSGRFFGPVAGTLIALLLPEILRGSSAPWLGFMKTWYLLVFGIAVVVLMVWLPGGLLSIPERFRRRRNSPCPGRSSK